MPAKKPNAKSRKGVASHAPADWRVRIRMHRQGVGDCFLITFRNQDQPVHMLIDCGVLPGSPKEHNHLEEVAGAVRDEVMGNGGKLAVLVATHEHADHVSGFEPGKKTAGILDEIPVEEVWMAWTENPDDEIARNLNGHLSMNAMAAAAALPRLKRIGAKKSKSSSTRFQARAGESAEDITDILCNRGVDETSLASVHPQTNSFMGISGSPFGVGLSTTVRAAMDHIKSRVPANRLKTFMPGTVQSVPGLPKNQVRVFVLGPPHIPNLDKSPRHGPNDDIFHLSQGNLWAQARGLVAAASVNDEAAVEAAACRPFADTCGGTTHAPTTNLRAIQKAYHGEPWRSIDDDWLLAAGELAMQLDSATNNTSLVLAIEMVETGEVLLFPGDAQVENWETWRNLKWRVSDGSGAKEEVRGEDLLRRTVFYKVGHHGSHNGTLNEHGLKLMPSGSLVAMCPVVHAVTSKRKGDWKEIPKPSLCAALEEKCGEGFLRMDAPSGELAGRLDGRVQETDLWVDYHLV